MAKRAKAAAKPARKPSKFAKVRSGELVTLLDFVRFAVSRFAEAKLTFAHGTTDSVAEAAFLVCETLHLHPDQFEIFATARVTAAGERPTRREAATKLPSSATATKARRASIWSIRLFRFQQ